MRHGTNDFMFYSFDQSHVAEILSYLSFLELCRSHSTLANEIHAYHLVFFFIGAGSIVQEGPSEANLIDPKPAPTKQVNPLARVDKVLKFRVFLEAKGEDGVRKQANEPSWHRRTAGNIITWYSAPVFVLLVDH